MSSLLLFAFAVLSSLGVLLVATFLGATWLVCWFGGELSAWVQALGAILAIVAGFAAAIWQIRSQRMEDRSERQALAQASHILAFEALSTASDRLEAAMIPPNSGKVMSLQGDRTTEMILAMREFETTKLPAELLPLFVRIRSHIFAINERITDVYRSEESNKTRIDERQKRLVSAVRVRTTAVDLFNEFNDMVARFGAKKLTVSTDLRTESTVNERHSTRHGLV